VGRSSSWGKTKQDSRKRMADPEDEFGGGGDDWNEDGATADAADDGDWGNTDLVDANEAAVESTTKAAAPKEEKKYNADKLESYTFDDAAFGPLPKRIMPAKDLPNLASKLNGIMTDSCKGVAGMKSQTRDARPVLDILGSIYSSGLSTMSQNINTEIIPALHYIIHVANGMKAKDAKRISMLQRLADAMMDCQQIQAREILRIYGDLTCQSQTLETQTHYFLLKQKENALDQFITMMHVGCDLDHTQTTPGKQRAHLKSAYIDLLGREFGLEAVEAAKEDRFLTEARSEIQNGVWAGVGMPVILLRLKRTMSLPIFVGYLLADINNQSKTAERLINRDVIFKWAETNMSKQDAHLVFYDEDRAADYEGQTPNKPVEANKYQPFLSQKLLLRMLLTMGFIKRA